MLICARSIPPRLFLAAASAALPLAAQTKVINAKISNQTEASWTFTLEHRATEGTKGVLRRLCWVTYKTGGQTQRLLDNGDNFTIPAKSTQQVAFVLNPLSGKPAVYGIVSLKDPAGRQRNFNITLDDKQNVSLTMGSTACQPAPGPDKAGTAAWKDPVVALDAKALAFSLNGSYDTVVLIAKDSLAKLPLESALRPPSKEGRRPNGRNGWRPETGVPGRTDLHSRRTISGWMADTTATRRPRA